MILKMVTRSPDIPIVKSMIATIHIQNLVKTDRQIVPSCLTNRLVLVCDSPAAPVKF